MRLCSQLYFPLEKEVNGKINSLQAYYCNELKKSSEYKKVELGRITPKSQNGLISLKLIWFDRVNIKFETKFLIQKMCQINLTVSTSERFVKKNL